LSSDALSNADAAGPVPADFPRSRHASAVSGFQLKVAVRLVDGEFTDGWTEEELAARYDACRDLVDQLTVYCRRKLAERPGSTLPELLPRVRRGVVNKGWDLTEAELDWVMACVAKEIGDADRG